MNYYVIRKISNGYIIYIQTKDGEVEVQRKSNYEKASQWVEDKHKEEKKED